MIGDDNIEDDSRYRVFFSVSGVIEFDATAVAEALRSRPLTTLEAAGLANLLEGKHPAGLRLKMVGRGKNWQSWREHAERYDRCIAIGAMMERLQLEGLTWEESTIDTADYFQVSESTVARDFRLFRIFQGVENT